MPVDVTDKEQVDHLFDETAAQYGGVDIAFNNAGISPPDDDSIETTELPAWDKVQLVNLTSVYLCSRAALRHMVPAGKGSIINTASFVAVLGSATSQISYTASKGGVLAMTRPGWTFQAGIVLFSGSLYALALTDVKVLGAITPLGGLAFLAGWIWLAVSALRAS